jgi:hypothetical protein
MVTTASPVTEGTGDKAVVPNVTKGYKRAQDGPPFKFLGHMAKTQKIKFYEWLDKKDKKHIPIHEWYRIRAHQMRKTAGLLEEYYKTKHPDPDEVDKLEPSFVKDEWQPNKDGHFVYVNRVDIIPGVAVSKIKDRYKHILQRDDEGEFWMNWLRNHIERHEDKANMHKEAQSKVATLRAELDAMFEKPEYEAVLVDNTKMYKGQPYFRVNPLDEPTIWEKEQFSHRSDKTISMKMGRGDV